MKLPCKKVNRYLQRRLKQCHRMPTRIHIVFDELNSLLLQDKKIDIFELVIELILQTDQSPAQDMANLLAALDGSALCNLGDHDVANAASFIRDTMLTDYVRWQVQEIKTMQQEKLKQKQKDS